VSESPLIEKLASGEKRPRVIDGCVRLIDSEVASKRGLSSVPVKGAFRVLKGIRPGFVAQCVDHLLDDFCRALDPFYVEWSAKAPASRPPIASELVAQQDRVAGALLGVTDQRAKRAQNRVLLKLYNKLRGAAEKHVKAALPGLGRTIEPHLQQ